MIIKFVLHIKAGASYLYHGSLEKYLFSSGSLSISRGSLLLPLWLTTYPWCVLLRNFLLGKYSIAFNPLIRVDLGSWKNGYRCFGAVCHTPIQSRPIMGPKPKSFFQSVDSETNNLSVNLSLNARKKVGISNCTQHLFIGKATWKSILHVP